MPLLENHLALVTGAESGVGRAIAAGRPEDMVGPTIFLASDLSAFVTRAIVMTDGGYRSI